LSHPGLAQLRQRIAIQAHLEALPATEVVQYIHHRLHVAGYRAVGLFTPGALELIVLRSKGIPRLINHLCFSALSLGCALQQKQITSEVVRQAASDLALEDRALTHGVPPPHTLRATPSAWTSVQSFCSWFRDNLFRPRFRLIQASVVSLVAVCLAIYLGIRIRPGANSLKPSPEIHRIIASPQIPPELESPGAQEVASRFDAARGQETAQASNREDYGAFFTYVVQPHDTLRDLCISTFGRYDNAILAEIRKSNPELRDPNHLYVGEEIRFSLARLDTAAHGQP